MGDKADDIFQSFQLGEEDEKKYKKEQVQVSLCEESEYNFQKTQAQSKKARTRRIR